MTSDDIPTDKMAGDRTFTEKLTGDRMPAETLTSDVTSTEKLTGSVTPARKMADDRISAGKLILVPTPIGNLEDITARALRALKEADLIAAEDTRNSLRLLNHFDIHTPMTSYHEYNKIEKAQELTRRMLQGVTVALITDAGTPGISDPGEDLVRIAVEAGIVVSTLPGPCACTTALTMSALPTRRFCFEAFLPADKKERQEVLEELKTETRTIVMYEAPHRLKRTLEELKSTLGDRRISLCRELTKIHEEVLRMTLSEALELYGQQDPRGEYVIVMEGRSRRDIVSEEQHSWDEVSLPEHMQIYLDKGMDRKDAMKAVAKDRGLSKRDVYRILEENKGNGSRIEKQQTV